MNTFTWIVQIILALVFLLAGGAKVFIPKEKLKTKLAWVNDFSEGMVKFIGTMEVLGALGMILPMVLRIFPFLTPFAGLGLSIIMLLAAFTHFRRKEYKIVPVNLILFTLAVFVFAGRFYLT